MSALGGAWNVQVLIDEEREVYAEWGLGVSTAYYLLNPWTQIAQRKLGSEEGIWGREVGEGGNRWQVGGAVSLSLSFFLSFFPLFLGVFFGKRWFRVYDGSG